MNKTKIFRLIPVVLLGASVLGCQQQEVSDAPKPVRPVAWIKAAASDSAQIRRLSGVLQAQESASLSFEVGGKVESVQVQLGDVVKRGQSLAVLEQSSYQLNKNAAKSQLQELEAQQVEVKTRFNRVSDLLKKGFVSKADYDLVKAELDRTNSAVSAAKSRLDLASKDLKNTKLIMPYDGKITGRRIEPSQQVNSGQTVFTVEGKQGLEISVMVPETMIGYLEKGQTHKAHFPTVANLDLDVQISEVGLQAGSANGFPVTLVIQQQNSDLRTGMTAEVDFTFIAPGITGYQGATVRIPPSAILAGEGNNNYVFVYDQEKKVVAKRQIQTENIINNEVLISNGLSAGEIIVTAGVPYLYDGQAVSLLNTGTKRFN